MVIILSITNMQNHSKTIKKYKINLPFPPPRLKWEKNLQGFAADINVFDCLCMLIEQEWCHFQIQGFYFLFVWQSVGFILFLKKKKKQSVGFILVDQELSFFLFLRKLSINHITLLIILRVSSRELSSVVGTMHNICKVWGSNFGHHKKIIILRVKIQQSFDRWKKKSKLVHGICICEILVPNSLC
jgi:hypothetical protein